MPAPRGISVRVQWAGIGLALRACRLSIEQPMNRASLHSGIVTRPLQSVTVAGQHRIAPSEIRTGGRAPVSRLTRQRMDRGTRERARILTYQAGNLALGHADASGGLFPGSCRGWRSNLHSLKAHSKKSVSSDITIFITIVCPWKPSLRPRRQDQPTVQLTQKLRKDNSSCAESGSVQRENKRLADKVNTAKARLRPC